MEKMPIDPISALFDVSPVPMTLTTLDGGRFVSVSRSFLERVGLRRDQVIGHTVIDLGLISEERRAQLLRRLEKDGSVQSFEVSFGGRTGAELNGLLSGTIIEVSGEKCLLSVIQDLTEQLRSERRLALHSQVFEHLDEAVVVLDREGVIIEWNGGAERLLGFQREEAVGRLARSLLAPGQAGRLGREIEDALKHDGRWRGQMENVARDGSVVPLEAVVVPIRDSRNRRQATVTVCRDLSEKRQAQMERKQLEEQLLQARRMEDMGRFAGGVAHDFNNLLSPILGAAELGLAELDPSSHHHNDLEQIRDAALRANDLTKELLALGRKQHLRRMNLDLNEVIGDSRRFLGRLIREDIELELRLDPHVGTVNADAAQIRRVLMNLVINARDALPRGGRITITTGNVYLDEEQTKVEMGVAPGPYAMVTVVDTGFGMDDATRSRVFEPYFTTKKQGAGAGLGLATVYGITKQHNGAVWVFSGTESGTTVKVCLPRVDEAAETTRPSQTTGEGIYGDETVLVVEDELVVRRMVCRILRTHGYNVLDAKDGVHALELLRNHDGPLDLLLTDVIMPGLNGKQLRDRVSQDRPETRVLYMSGYADEVIAHHGVLDEEGAFLQKPFSVQGLTRKVREVLDAESE